MAERKKFINVSAPIIDSDIQVLGTPKDLHNRTIKLDLSRKMRGKGVMITLQIFNQDEKLVSVPKRIEILKSYIRRILRKRTDNVEDSFTVQCSDISAKMKPFLVTRKKVSRAVRRNLRNTAREFLQTYTKDKTYNELCGEILEGTIQKTMLPRLKKVYPLAFCDIRVFETTKLYDIDLDEATKISDKVAEDADTPEAETAAEEEVEEEAIEEAVEEAESDEETKEEDVKEEKSTPEEEKEEDTREVEDIAEESDDAIKK